MHTNTHVLAWHCPHVEVLILRPKIYAQICIHIHIHMCINAYIYIYIHTCTHIYIYMSAHIHKYTYIHTHIQNVYMQARKHLSNDGAAATAQEARLDAKKLRPSPCPLQSGGGVPFVASSLIARPRGTTNKRRTTTTNSSSSHHHDSAPSRPHPLICTDVELIHPIHGPPKLPAWLWPPETKSCFCHFGGLPLLKPCFGFYSHCIMTSRCAALGDLVPACWLGPEKKGQSPWAIATGLGPSLQLHTSLGGVQPCQWQLTFTTFAFSGIKSRSPP